MTTMMVGCAQDYEGIVVRQPGNMTGQGITPMPVGVITEIISLTWGRVRKRASQCTVTMSKCPSNQEWIISEQNWTAIDPWAHELWLYRDGQLAWQGPIMVIQEDKNSFILTARDMVQWVYGREIREDYGPQTWSAPGIAHSLVNTYFTPDDPDLIRNIVDFFNTTAPMTVQYDHAQFTIGQKWDDLVQSGGLDYTTMGRAIYLMGTTPPNYHQPFVMDADKIIGDIQIQKSGLDYGNHAVGLGEGIAFGVGPTAEDVDYYGKVTYPPTRFGDVTDMTQLQNATQNLYNSKRLLTPQLVIPAGSSLSPDTVVYNDAWEMNEENLRLALSHLIPGFLYMMRTGEQFCRPASYPMIFSELAVSWTEENKGETVAVSFDNLTAATTDGG